MLPSSWEVRKQWELHGPGIDMSAMKLAGFVKSINNLLDQAVVSLYEGAPVTPHEMDLLVPLRYAQSPLIARRIADDLGLSRAGVSQGLAKLEARGLIERTPNPADRRAALVSLTDAGREVVDDLFPRQLEIASRLLAGLGDRRSAVLGALETLADVLQSPNH
ncbi:MarR family transcriptional regulator [Streptomyces sp. NPDC052052]|uniref:MarR family winged helix-turn-helix transcriptional regulator n=1 Tax=Streptomyces sp. NPDC052052 TaxID=3154756 RepID=UPI0034287297